MKTAEKRAKRYLKNISQIRNGDAFGTAFTYKDPPPPKEEADAQFAEFISRVVERKERQRMKRIVEHTAAKQDAINITAAGLTRSEEEQVKALVRKIARKRKHDNRPRLIYDLIFN